MVQVLIPMSKSLSDVENKFIHDHLEELLEYCGIEYSKSGNRYSFTCPLHDFADNPTAIIMYKNTNWVFWKCQTHYCHEKSSVRGNDFFRMLLGRNGNLELKQLLSRFGKLPEATTDPEYLSVIKFINLYGESTPTEQSSKPVALTRDIIRARLQLQPEFFLQRKYSSELLDKYDIGLCMSQGSEMYQRVVIPIYDEHAHYMIGCTGRTIIENWEPKWRHSEGLRTSDILFNYWYAKDFMKEFRTAIMVEGPGDALRLIDHQIPALAMFNADLKQGQINLLDKCGVTNLIMMLDNDEAGEAGLANLHKKFSRYYKIFEVKYSTHDPGDLQPDEISEYIKPQLRKYISINAY